MLKKYITIFILVIFLSLSSIVFVEASTSNIDKSKLKDGIISINYKSKNNLAVRISKGNIKEDHILKSNNSFPLGFGDGEYTITVLENVEGKKYKQVESEVVTLQLSDKNSIYLESIQMINWNQDMNAVKKAKELTKDAKNDKEKVTAIYNYIVKNISYDNNKAKSVKSGYIPDIEEILGSGQAICHDYSALFAGMLRSINIPTKLVMGQKDDIKEYHAWNQVYLGETNEWVVIDTTYDAGLKKGNVTNEMIKDGKEYKIEKQY